MSLDPYAAKRKLDATPEPEGGSASSGLPIFVVQKHSATRLHYDFRLEHQGVLKSWAVPKGPSQSSSDKRLAMMVEDHPMDYRQFEGIIPRGNYGAGTVMVWDTGTYTTPDASAPADVEQELQKGLAKGHIAVRLNGTKLRGIFDVIRTRGKEDNAWLLIKRSDEFESSEEILAQDRSVLTSRNLEEIASNAPAKGDIWISNRASSDLEIDDAPVGPIPRNVQVMLAREVDAPFDNADWLFEVKWDGYRAIAEVDLSGSIQLYSRNDLSFNSRYPDLVSDLAQVGHECVLDGEIVCVDERGISQFQWLQDHQRQHRGTLVYYAFDLLYLDGHDLRSLPLARRKELLTKITPRGRIRFSDHVLERGTAFFAAAVLQDLEGIVAKRSDSKYESGKRSDKWLKIKHLKRQLAVVGGITEGRNSRKYFGALVLGVYVGSEFVYIGHTGGGFGEADLARLSKDLKPLETDSSPFVEPPKTNSPVTWISPNVVVEVIFRGWTDAGLMRQPTFERVVPNVRARDVMRDDGHQSPVSAETQQEPLQRKSSEDGSQPDDSKTQRTKKSDLRLEIDGHSLAITNFDKVLWPNDGYTKGDLITYYREISETILPYLRDRPESLNRHPNGIDRPGFFQKDTPGHTPKWIETVDIESTSQGGRVRYLLCQDEATLVYLANLACIELNPWFSRTSALDRPDFVVIDLDPHKADFANVVTTAQTVKSVLDEFEVPSYPKTSGSRGMHIAIPLQQAYDFEVGKQFCLIVAGIVHGRLPRITSLERSPAKREGMVYLDCLQNRPGQTIAAAYSVRPRPGATVSTPLEWDEVGPQLDPKSFTIRSMHDRLSRVGDLWAPVLGKGIDLPAILRRLEG